MGAGEEGEDFLCLILSLWISVHGMGWIWIPYNRLVLFVVVVVVFLLILHTVTIDSYNSD